MSSVQPIKVANKRKQKLNVSAKNKKKNRGPVNRPKSIIEQRAEVALKKEKMRDKMLDMALVKRGNLKLDRTSRNQTMSLSDGNRLQSATPTMPIEVPVSETVFHGVPFALITEAIRRGYSNSDNPNNPFLAYNYLIFIVEQVALGAVPSAIDVPLFLAWYLQAIKPKSVPYKDGKISYKWIFTQASTPVSTEQLGPAAYNIVGTFYVPNPSGSPINTTIPPLQPPTINYSIADGQLALTSVFQYLAQTGLPQMRLVSILAKNEFSNDVSAFGINRGDPGGGFAGVGGFGNQVSLETFIRTPLASCHVAVVDGTDNIARWTAKKIGYSGGDSILAGGAFMRCRIPLQVRTKAKWPIKAYDGNSWDDVLFRAWQMAVANAFSDPDTITAIDAYGEGPLAAIQAVMLPFLCPLTGYEAQLMNRNTYMLAFKDSQTMVQSLYPIIPTSNSDNQFAFYTSTVGTCPIESTATPLYPVPWLENIRASTILTCATPSGVQMVIPGVGKYSLDQLDYTQYDVTVQYRDVEYTLSLFASEADESRVKLAKTTEERNKEKKRPDTPDMQKFKQVAGKGKEKKSPTAEAYVSLYDGSYEGTYYQINDPATIGLYVQAWNAAIRGPVQPYFASLDSLGNDGGIDCLRVSPYTTIWGPLPDQEAKKINHHPRLGTGKKYGSINTVYDQRAIVAVTAQFPPDTAAWENILGSWETGILLNNPNQTTLGTSVSPIRVQNLYEEPYFIPIGTPESFVTLGNRHASFAQQCVRARGALPSKSDEFLSQAAAKGRGSILSTLGTILSTATPLAQTALQILPQFLG
jgi:hypothetical protein